MADFEAKIKLAKEDPYAFAERELGVTYDAWTNRILSGGKPEKKDEVAEVREKLDAITKAQEEKDRKAAEHAQREAYERDVKLFRSAVSDSAAKAGDRFELLSLAGDEGLNLVQTVVERYHAETGEAPPMESAMEEVESYLLEYASKLSKAKKLTPQTPAPAAKTEAEKKPAAKPGATLTNRATPVAPEGVPEFKNERERERAIIEKYRGKLYK